MSFYSCNFGINHNSRGRLQRHELVVPSSGLYTREPSAFQDIPSFSQSNTTFRSDGDDESVAMLILAILLWLLILLPLVLVLALLLVIALLLPPPAGLGL